MKTICDFLRKHALLLLAALVVVSVPVGGALGKYVKNVEVTKTLNLNVSMVTVEYTIDKNKMWKAISRLPKGSTTLKFVKGNDEALKGLEELSPSGIQDDSLNSGEIGVYQSTDGTTIYIAPMDGSRNVMYAPKDSSWLLCGSYLGLSDSLQTIYFDNLDTSRVTDMASMFMNCYALTSLNLDGLDTSNVTRMASMFANCYALTSLDLSKLDTSKVTSMNSMFYSCNALAFVDLSSFNTENVTNMGFMFENCKALVELDLSSFNTSELTYADSMFDSSSALKTIKASSKFVTDKINRSSDMFRNCTNLVGGNGTKYSYSHTDHTYARIDNAPTFPGYFTSKNANNTTNTATINNLSNGMNIS